jgi:hypothetical protein
MVVTLAETPDCDASKLLLDVFRVEEEGLLPENFFKKKIDKRQTFFQFVAMAKNHGQSCLIQIFFLLESIWSRNGDFGHFSSEITMVTRKF